ncbi:MAG: TetR/AcrR family transcriptional regulator [Maricaulaceae bacterium]
MVDPIAPPQQDRARRTRDKLLTALEALLTERGFEQIAVADIAARAGVAVGSVYSHFKDKTAFLQALLDQRKSLLKARLKAAEQMDAAAQLAAAGGLAPALQMIAQSAMAQVQADAHILRAVYYFARTHPEIDTEEWFALYAKAEAGFGVVLDVYAGEIMITDRATALRMLSYFFNVIFIEAIMFAEAGLNTVGRMSPDALAREAAHMAYGYLITPPSTV